MKFHLLIKKSLKIIKNYFTSFKFKFVYNKKVWKIFEEEEEEEKIPEQKMSVGNQNSQNFNKLVIIGKKKILGNFSKISL